MKFQKVENAHTILSDKAYAFYVDTTPLDILTDGEKFQIRGAMEFDCADINDLNASLEELADEFAAFEAEADDEEE